MHDLYSIRDFVLNRTENELHILLRSGERRQSDMLILVAADAPPLPVGSNARLTGVPPFSFLRSQNDLKGQNLLAFAHPDDHAFVKQQLIPNNLDKLFDSNPVDENGEPRPRTEAEEAEIDQKLMQDKRKFTIR